MTILEAAQLVIQASAIAEGGEVYVLNMGDPVKIINLAKSMIRLSGNSVKNKNNKDGIEIKFTGLRPGEKLYEELLIDNNPEGTCHPKIMKAKEKSISIDEARMSFKDINFLKGNALDSISVNSKFDIITMLGVLCIFDDYNLVLRNVLSWLNPGGRLILHNTINDFDIDVFVKYKHSSVENDKELESGWNIISRKSLELVCNKYGARLTSCTPFEINVDLKPTLDPMRSWTEMDNLGFRQIYNALNIRQPQKIAVIDKLS